MAPATPFDWTYLELCGALKDISYHVVCAVGDLPHNLWNILAASLGMRDRDLAPGDMTFHIGLADWLFGQNREIMVSLIAGTLLLMFSLINVLMFIWFERKLLARFMDRRGPMVAGPFGLLQNVWDGMKLMTKENAHPAPPDMFAFFLCPVILVGSAFAAAGALPMSPKVQIASIDLDLLWVLMLFAFSPYAIFLGGWASYNKCSLIGGMRSAAQMLAGEVPFFLSVGGVILITGSFRFADIVAWQDAHGWLIFAQPLGAILFTIAVLIELERIPFDLPEAESELVEGWTTEYSGLRWGMLWLGGYLRGYVGCAMIVLLFLGGWGMPNYKLGELPLLTPHIIPPVFIFLLKSYLVFAVFVWIRSAYPRLRTDQLLNTGWKRLLPATLVNIAVAGFLVVDQVRPGEVVQTPFGPMSHEGRLPLPRRRGALLDAPPAPRPPAPRVDRPDVRPDARLVRRAALHRPLPLPAPPGAALGEVAPRPLRREVHLVRPLLPHLPRQLPQHGREPDGQTPRPPVHDPPRPPRLPLHLLRPLRRGLSHRRAHHGPEL